MGTSEAETLNVCVSPFQEEELQRIWGRQIAMMKDHHIVLDRALEKVHIRLDELKVRRAGWAREGPLRALSLLGNSGPPQAFPDAWKARAPVAVLLAIACT